MDAVVELASREGAPTVRRMLDEALDHGIDSVVGAPSEMVDLFVQLDRRPEWFDVERAERGRVEPTNATL